MITKGEETRERILDRAMAMAAVVGLEGLSIGDLAKETGMSKRNRFKGSAERRRRARWSATQHLSDKEQQRIEIAVGLLAKHRRAMSSLQGWWKMADWGMKVDPCGGYPKPPRRLKPRAKSWPLPLQRGSWG